MSKNGSTVYIQKEVLEELQKLEISSGALKATTLSDKIAQLIYLYKESQK